MPPELVPLTDEGESILLDKPIVLLGRHQECDVQLNSRKVSRRHCCLAQVEDYLVIRDLCSTNGIRINGNKIIEGRLQSGDELTIGNFQFKVRWPEQEREAKKVASEKPDFPASKPPEPDMSVEEPVPLAEPSPDDDVIDVELLSMPASNSNGSPKSESAMEDQPPSLILPDNLQLSPSSSSGLMRKD